MRTIRFALAGAAALLIAGAVAAQQPQAQPQAQQAQGQAQGQPQAAGQGQGRGQGGGAGAQRNGGGAGPSGEQQVQDAQRAVREQVGRGGGGGGQAAAPAQPDDPDVDAYVNKTDFFSLSVPCKFTEKDTTWTTEYDSKVPGHVYNCTSGTTDYEISVINYTDIIAIRRAQEHTESGQGDAYARIDVAASIDYACTKIRNEAAKTTYDAWHYINLIPGHELQTTLANGKRVYSAVYLHEFRLYIMKATIPANGIPPLLYTQSFAVVRPDGTAIRYPTIYRHPWQ